MKAVNIIWETDEIAVSLPNEVELPSSIDENDFDSINDFLSGSYGWLVVSYDLE